MKNALIFLLLLLISHTGKSQFIGNKENPFGEGIADVQLYVFSPNVIAPDFVDNKMDTPFLNYTYYIKGLKILKKDGIDSSLLVPTVANDTSKNNDAVVTTHLEITMQHPSYLIDWSKRISYQFYTKAGKKYISKTLLKDNSYDVFYKIVDSTRPRVLTLSSKPEAIIDGKECFKGTIKAKDSSISTFYCTASTSKIQSPLNSLVPRDFPYQVLCIKSSVDWTQLDGSKAKGTMIFQVDRLQEAKLDDSMFQLPKNIEIKENVSWQEMYSR